MLDEGLHNDQNDPELVFAGVTFADAMSVALRDPVVFQALQRVPWGFWR